MDVINGSLRDIDRGFKRLSLGEGTHNPNDENAVSSPVPRNHTPFRSRNGGAASPFYKAKGPESHHGHGYNYVPDGPTSPFRRSTYGHMPYTRGGFRSSRSWVSPEQRNAQEFTIVRNCMRRLFKNSEVSQWKHDDYLKHRQAMVESDKARLARKLKAREEDLKWRNISAEATGAYAYGLGSLVHGCLHTVGNRSLVLGEQTIWCLDWTNGKDEIAPWPTGAEMKWEGDDRAKTNVGRFLPLPRERTPGCAWADWLMIKQYPLDEVARVPTLEDIYLPVDEIDDEVKYDLITKDLEDAMNDILKT